MTASNDPPGTDDFGTRLVIARGAGNLIHPSGRIMSSTKPAEPMDIKQRFGEVTEMSRNIRKKRKYLISNNFRTLSLRLLITTNSDNFAHRYC